MPTFYSNYCAEIKHGDGLPNVVTYSDVHDYPTGDVTESPESVNLFQQAHSPHIDYYSFRITRAFFYFDTSSIPGDVTIIDVRMNFYIHYISTAGRSFTVVVQNGQPTYPHNPAEAGDFLHSRYSGNGGEVAPETGTNTITFNEAARDWINKGGETKLALRISRDIDNDATPVPDPGEDANHEAVYIYHKAGYYANLVITYSTTPVATTQAVSQAGYKCGMGNGTIISGENITERGFEIRVEVDYFAVGGDIWWGLIGFNDEGGIVYTGGQRTGTLIKRETETGSFSAGAFAIVLGYADIFGDPSSVFNDALKECTSYTYRAYATNDLGTGYGSWVAFSTLCYPRGHQADDTLPISDVIPVEIVPAVAPFVPPFDEMRVFMEEFPDLVFPEFEFPVFKYPDVPPYTGSWIGGFYYRKAYTKKDLDELRKKCKIFLDNSVEYALVLNHNMQVLKQYLNDMHDYLGADEYNTFKFLIPTQWLNKLMYKPLDVMDFKAIINNFINNSISNASNVNHNFRLIRDGLVVYLASGDVDIGFEPIEVRTKTSKDNNPDVERLKKVIDALSREMANNYMTINHNLRIVKATLI